MYCQKCGAQNDDNATTCAQCEFAFVKQKNKKVSMISEKPHMLYAIVALLVGSLFIGSYTYFRYEDLAMKKKEQESQETQRQLRQISSDYQEKMRNICMESADNHYW